MKIFLLLLMLSPLSINTYGQLTKNTWLIGGAGSSYTYTETFNAPSAYYTAKYTSIDIAASVGYFFLDKLAGGLRPAFSSYKGSSSGGVSTNSYRLAIGPFVRYYFLNEGKRFNLLADISYKVGVNNWKDAYSAKGKFNTFHIQAGAEFYFNSTVGLELLIGYKNQIASIDNSPSAYNSSMKGLQTSIGLQFHLAK